jgi:hypothetical protein
LAGAGRSLGHERARQRRASSDDRLARETLAHPVLKPSQMGSTTGPSDRPLRPECGPRRRLTWGTLSGRSDSRDSDRHGEPARAPGCLCACIGMRDSPRLSKIRDSGSQARFTGTAALIRSLAGRLRTGRQCRLPIRAKRGTWFDRSEDRWAEQCRTQPVGWCSSVTRRELRRGSSEAFGDGGQMPGYVRWSREAQRAVNCRRRPVSRGCPGGDCRRHVRSPRSVGVLSVSRYLPTPPCSPCTGRARSLSSWRRSPRSRLPSFGP